MASCAAQSRQFWIFAICPGSSGAPERVVIGADDRHSEGQPCGAQAEIVAAATVVLAGAGSTRTRRRLVVEKRSVEARLPGGRARGRT